MTLDPGVFKAYDVRGVVPDELDADGAYRIARAYVDEFEPTRIVVGHDMRLTSEELSEAAIRGALDAGCDVDDIGLAGTEMMYFAVGEYGYEGGFTITASHNPSRYNGLKMVRRGALPVGGDSGLDRVRERALAGDFKQPDRLGVLGQRTVLDEFAARCLSLVDPSAILPLQVVIDAANGMGGHMITPILARLPIRAERCHFEPDGSFPHYEPNPLLPESREFIVNRVRETGADLGIAFDGDGDRCFFIDDTGAFVPGDFITALIAELMLQREPGATIIYDVRASRAVPELVERMGGRAVPSRVGHAYIKHRIRQEHAIFAGEVSGHYYFRDFYGVDTGIVPALVVLELVSRAGGKLSSLLAKLQEGHHLSGEINSKVRDVPLKLQELKEHFGPAGAGGRVSHLDGLTVEFDDWWFNVRPSNTEPLLRLNLEAPTEHDMEHRRDEVLAVINA
ncbi:MAG: phosphomannomutase/phosphoglucomutase [Gaiellales bacterium]